MIIIIKVIYERAYILIYICIYKYVCMCIYMGTLDNESDSDFWGRCTP